MFSCITHYIYYNYAINNTALIIPLHFVAQMLVYSLGMTLYWSVDFHLPQNQVGATESKQ